MGNINDYRISCCLLRSFNDVPPRGRPLQELDRYQMTEEWRDIVDHEGYQVSNLGRVRSLDRQITQGSRWGGVQTSQLTGKILSGNNLPNGYISFRMGKNSRKHLAHRLVAHAFLEPDSNRPHVNHKDSDRKNNTVENLEWCTRSENIRHCFDKGRDRWTKQRERAHVS